MKEPLVRAAGLRKAVGGVDILRAADLKLLSVEIHALVFTKDNIDQYNF